VEEKGREERESAYFTSPIHYPLKGNGNSFAEIKHFGNCPKFQTLYVTEALYQTLLERSNGSSISDPSPETFLSMIQLQFVTSVFDLGLFIELRVSFL
jgi:hypothetical protein